MNNKKIQTVLDKTERNFSLICSEVDLFVGNILQWADELEEIVEKEYAEAKESSSFQLPKTPSEKKTRNRKPINTLASKTSVLNTTVDNELICLDDTISTRTRAARRAATLKMSQFNITKERAENINEAKRETRLLEKTTKDESNTTFVVPQATTRTKPVHKNKQKEAPPPEPKSSMSEESESQEKEKSFRKKISRTLRTNSEHSSSLKTSEINIKNSVEEVAPVIVGETPTKRPSRQKQSRTLSSSSAEQQPNSKLQRPSSRSPMERQSRCKTERTLSRSPAGRQTRNKIQRSISGSPVSRQTRSQVQRSLSGGPASQQTRSQVQRSLSGSPANQQTRSQVQRSLSGSPANQQTRSQVQRSLSGSPASRKTGSQVQRSLSGSLASRQTRSQVQRSLSGSPAIRSSSLKSAKVSTKPPAVLRSSRNNISTSQDTCEVSGKKEMSPIAGSTFIMGSDERCQLNDSTEDAETTPRIQGETFARISKTSTPVTDGEKTPVIVREGTSPNEIGEATSESRVDATYFVEAKNGAEGDSEEVQVPKKKRKLKTEETFKENIEEMGNTRITRTKSKAIKQMIEENETKQVDLSNFAKKLLNRAKMTSLKKSQLAALLECNASTPTNGPGHGNNLPFGNLTSKSKYHMLLSGSKKFKTPLATLPNSAVKNAKPSGDKERLKTKATKRDSSIENLVKTASKQPKDDAREREIKLKSKKEKEEEAALKRQNVIKSKQEELKRKNELKHQMAMKLREKLVQEKYNNMIQSEKEKEERHKLILQERQMKMKEEVYKKKMLTQQKIQETVERRRLEEEARIAKLREMEAEEQRLALEKQKEQERLEKRAQERLAEKKARDEYELKLKQELEAERQRAEKLSTARKYLQSASKMQSASKRQKFGLIGERREWDYKPRSENDYGLEDEHSEVDSEDERSYDKTKPPVPWGKEVLNGKSHIGKILTLEMLCEFMPCYQKSPDIYKMFKMTPSKRIKRSSSAIWNTPSS